MRILERVPIDFLRLLFVCFLGATVVNILRPTMAFRALDLGADAFQVGLVASSFSALAVFLAIPVGRMVDRRGARSFLTFGMLLLALGNVVCLFIDSIFGLVVAQLGMGLGHLMNLVSGQVLVGELDHHGMDRDERYAWYTTLISLGQLVGPLIGGAAIILVSSPYGVANAQIGAFALAAAIAALGVVLSLVGQDRAPRASKKHVVDQPRISEGTSRVLRRPGVVSAMAVGIIAISSVDLLIAYLPAIGLERGLSVAFVSVLLAVRAGFGLISRLLMPALKRRLGRKRLLAAGMGSAGIAALALVPNVGEPILIVAMAVIGLGLGVAQPISLAWVVEVNPPGERGTALAVRVTGNRLALLVTPTVVGALAHALGLGVVFVAIGAASTAGGWIAKRSSLDRTSGGGEANAP